MSAFITVSPSRRRLARIMADQVERATSKWGQTYTGLERPDAFYIAYMFEQAVLTYFRDRECRYEPVIGASDNGDIVLMMEAGFEIIADCKAASEAHHKAIMMPLIQARDHIVPIYIGGRILNDTDVEIVGYLHADDFYANSEFHNMETKIPTVWNRLDALMDIEFLHDKMMPGKPIEKYPAKVMEEYKSTVDLV